MSVCALPRNAFAESSHSLTSRHHVHSTQARIAESARWVCCIHTIRHSAELTYIYRQVRCDGPASNGSCALCASSGIECIFAESATRRGPPKGYVESLERRLEAMESVAFSCPEARELKGCISRRALLQSLSTATSPDALQSLLQDGRSQLDGGGGAGSFSAEGVRNHSASASPAGVSSASSPCDGMYAVNGNATGTGSNTALSDAASASLDSMDQLADVLDQLSVDKVGLSVVVPVKAHSDSLALSLLSSTQDRYVGRGSGLHLAHSVNDLTHTGMSFPNEDDSVPSLVEKMIQTDHLHLASSTASSAKMPPPELRARLVDAYFDVINVQVAVVHRPSFDRHVANGLLESDSSFRSLCEPRRSCTLLTRLIVLGFSQTAWSAPWAPASFATRTTFSHPRPQPHILTATSSRVATSCSALHPPQAVRL